MLARREPELFSDRIARRLSAWWGRPKWSNGRALVEVVHRHVERRRLHRPQDAPEAWRCCRYWQRALLNKWNARVFASRFGCRVPQLFWFGADRAPLPQLPRELVIRPVFGSSRQGIYVVVDGCDQLRQQPLSRAQLVAATRDRGRRWWPNPVLVEELVRLDGEERVLPIEIKLHVFGGQLGLIQLLERTGAHAGSFRAYTPDWRALDDPIQTALPLAKTRPRPAALDDAVGLAVRMGAELGTYLRIDFFIGRDDVVFNELSSTPGEGRGFTPFGDRLLGELWNSYVPDAL